MNTTEGTSAQLLEELTKAGLTFEEANNALRSLTEQELRSRKSVTLLGGKQARKERRARERRTAKTARRTEQGA